jgi:hypothetical protein
MTGHPPFQELPSDEVERLYEANTFPELTDIPCRDIIHRCWHNEMASAQEIYSLIQVIEMERPSEIDTRGVYR